MSYLCPITQAKSVRGIGQGVYEETLNSPFTSVCTSTQICELIEADSYRPKKHVRFVWIPSLEWSSHVQYTRDTWRHLKYLWDRAVRLWLLIMENKCLPLLVVPWLYTFQARGQWLWSSHSVAQTRTCLVNIQKYLWDRAVRLWLLTMEN
jgi:hypothetical protein